MDEEETREMEIAIKRSMKERRPGPSNSVREGESRVCQRYLFGRKCHSKNCKYLHITACKRFDQRVNVYMEKGVDNHTN